MLADRTEQAIELSSRAIALARALDDQATLCHALCNLGTALCYAGNMAGPAFLRESLAVAVAAHEFDHACRAAINTVWSQVESLQPAAAAELLPFALALAEDNEHLIYRDYLLTVRGMVETAAGRYGEAIASSQGALAGPPPVRCAALAVINRAAVRMGAADPGQLEEMWALAENLNELQRTGPAAATLAEEAWLRGGREALQEPRTRDLISRVHAEALLRGRKHYVAELGYWLSRADVAVPIPFPDHPYAVQTAGRHREAAAAWETAGYPYESAAALSGSPLVEDGLAALARLDALGALPLAARVRRDLRDRGVVRVPRGPIASTRIHPDGLTPREAEVLELVRQGLTNAAIARRLVISERTADRHVSALLAKFGVHRRSDLGASDLSTTAR